jgi:hypothetical protein
MQRLRTRLLRAIVVRMLLRNNGFCEKTLENQSSASIFESGGRGFELLRAATRIPTKPRFLALISLDLRHELLPHDVL